MAQHCIIKNPNPTPSPDRANLSYLHGTIVGRVSRQGTGKQSAGLFSYHSRSMEEITRPSFVRYGVLGQ